MDMAPTEEKLASMCRDGLKAIATLNATVGSYRMRTIVREGVKDTLAAITTPIEVSRTERLPQTRTLRNVVIFRKAVAPQRWWTRLLLCP
jgi:hypothetical protein